MKNHRFFLLTTIAAFASSTAIADEQLWGFVRGAETLPAGKAEVYQFITLRTGKALGGKYRAWDFDTEYEYGFTDKLQASVSVVNHFFHLRNVDALENQDRFRFGGVEASMKYRILSPFKDVVGLAVRVEGGYMTTDDVAGLDQDQLYIFPQLMIQKNFLDDTLITSLNIGAQMSWGKKPAEEYDYEIGYEAGAALSYRFAPNWFIGAEAAFRVEYPEADFGFQEHNVVYAGPSIHYGAKNWWATATWGYQIYGNEFEEVSSRRAFAEQQRNIFRLKVGFNF